MPRTFFGIQGWEGLSEPDVDLAKMAGVGTLRTAVAWGSVEWQPGARSWQQFDAEITRANRAGLKTLPMFLLSPAWAAGRYSYPPRAGDARRRFAAFVRDAVARYGPRGNFWREHPELRYRPVRAWQVWNEPNVPAWWYGRPSPREYVSFLRLTRRAIKSRDPNAKVVLAGLPESGLPRSIAMVRFLRSIYRVRKARSLFDVVAIHPYARNPSGLLRALEQVRDVMDKAGDRRTPIWVTEMGWASGGDSRKFTTTPRGQARFLTRAYETLLRNRKRLRLELAVWFSWRDRRPATGERNWWGINTGLIDVSGQTKPSYDALRGVIDSAVP